MTHSPQASDNHTMYLPPLDTEGYQVVCIKYSFIYNLNIQLNSVRVRFVTDTYMY